MITGYACDSRTVDAEFMLAKREYISLTGRVRGADNVIAYHLRFVPGQERFARLDTLGANIPKLPRVKELQSEYATPGSFLPGVFLFYRFFDMIAVRGEVAG